MQYISFNKNVIDSEIWQLLQLRDAVLELHTEHHLPLLRSLQKEAHVWFRCPCILLWLQLWFWTKEGLKSLCSFPLTLPWEGGMMCPEHFVIQCLIPQKCAKSPRSGWQWVHFKLGWGSWAGTGLRDLDVFVFHPMPVHQPPGFGMALQGSADGQAVDGLVRKLLEMGFFSPAVKF